MKFSEQWLREWVSPDLDTQALVEQLTMAGLEVDGVSSPANDFSGVIVGEILQVEAHPDADKLRVCSVSDGSNEYQVVCGAPNVAVGQKVPFAQVGAVLGTDFKIKKAKLRGVESQGMICSEEELGFSEQSDGIMVLSSDAETGLDIRQYLQLDDALIEVDLTPNRGDCLSINGIAREVGVLNKLTVSSPTIDPVQPTIKDTFPITLDSPTDCPRYLGRIIRNINTEAQSPLWLQEKLRRSGIKCIDPVVDVTNYVLMELGQPMHAFDFEKLEGGINVRQAKKKEKLTLLDGKEVELIPNTLVIADNKKCLAIAGVMGGLDSSVTPATKTIFLESAFFTPTTIAGKARSYGLQTDAAHRYERGVDFNMPGVAMERATQLLLDIVGGEAGPVVEAVDSLPDGKTVSLRAQRIGRVLGIELADSDVEAYLTGLGLEIVERNEEAWTFNVPSWRFDIAIEEDLIEELARIYGYDNLPVTEPLSRFSLKPNKEANVGLSELREQLVAVGYQEVITYSFVERQMEILLGTPEEDLLALANPISQELSVMRTSLWPGLLNTLKHNHHRQQSRARLFESGLIFNNKNKELKQIHKVASILWGDQFPEQWGTQSGEVDFFDIKGNVEALLGLTLAKADFSFVAADHPALQSGQSAQILRDGQAIGWVGALGPNIQQHIDITGKIYLMELDLNAIMPAQLPVYSELSRFPLVRRDLAIVVDALQETGAIEALIRQKAGELLLDMVIFDVYQGQNIEKTKKSLALGLTFQHPSRTLTDEDINPIIDSCINVLEAQFNAELRM
jgi:phenylalanyl-tRNA synthetase beta chain